MTTSFHRVTITIDAPTAKQAYAALCDLLDQYNILHNGGIEWETDTYSIDGGEERDTSELWPDQKE